MPLVYALNLFDLADNDDYVQYLRRTSAAVEKHGGRLTALGSLSVGAVSSGGEPRQVMVLAEWPSAEALEAFRRDPDHAEVHALRGSGTQRYLWWSYDRAEDFREVLSTLGRLP